MAQKLTAGKRLSDVTDQNTKVQVASKKKSGGRKTLGMYSKITMCTV